MAVEPYIKDFKDQISTIVGTNTVLNHQNGGQPQLDPAMQLMSGDVTHTWAEASSALFTRLDGSVTHFAVGAPTG